MCLKKRQADGYLLPHRKHSIRHIDHIEKYK